MTIITNILLLRYNTLENYYYCRIFCNTTINTPYAEILLLLHNTLKYYYHHTICSNNTIIIVHCDNTTNIDVSARQRTWRASICQGTGQWGVGPYIQLAQVMSFRALPEQDTVLRVEYDILLAVGDAHCSQFNQHKLGRTSENEHMTEFEEVGACVGIHFVQTSLDPLPERQDWYCASNLVLRRLPVVVSSCRWPRHYREGCLLSPPIRLRRTLHHSLRPCGWHTAARQLLAHCCQAEARDDATHQLRGRPLAAAMSPRTTQGVQTRARMAHTKTARAPRQSTVQRGPVSAVYSAATLQFCSFCVSVASSATIDHNVGQRAVHRNAQTNVQ